MNNRYAHERVDNKDEVIELFNNPRFNNCSICTDMKTFTFKKMETVEQFKEYTDKNGFNFAVVGYKL